MLITITLTARPFSFISVDAVARCCFCRWAIEINLLKSCKRKMRICWSRSFRRNFLHKIFFQISDTWHQISWLFIPKRFMSSLMTRFIQIRRTHFDKTKFRLVASGLKIRRNSLGNSSGNYEMWENVKRSNHIQSNQMSNFIKQKASRLWFIEIKEKKIQIKLTTHFNCIFCISCFDLHILYPVLSTIT